MLPWHHVGFPIEFPKWWASGSNTIISSKFGFKMLSFLGSGAAWISGSQLSHATSAVESSMDGHSFFFGFPVNLGLKRWQMDGTKDVWITVWCFTNLYQPWIVFWQVWAFGERFHHGTHLCCWPGSGRSQPSSTSDPMLATWEWLWQLRSILFLWRWATSGQLLQNSDGIPEPRQMNDKNAALALWWRMCWVISVDRFFLGPKTSRCSNSNNSDIINIINFESWSADPAEEIRSCSHVACGCWPMLPRGPKG